LREAKKSNHKKNLHATLIFRGSALLSAGYNHDGIHAEQVALGAIWPNKRRGVHCINIMITKRLGKLGVSKPCEDCKQLLEDYGVKKVTYFDGKLWQTERI
jgi:cytidine deaminase